jgi:hypothetical protein
MLRHPVRAAIFLLVAVLALVVYFYLFGFRYMMFMSPATMMSTGIAGFVAIPVLIIGCLWAYFPSRLWVAIVGLTGLLLPPFYDRRLFPPLDAPFLGFVLVSIGLLVGATQLRRIAFESSPGPGRNGQQT